MSTQSKVATCSSVTIVICSLVSLLLVINKELYLDKWYDLLIGLSLGLLTNSVLILVISIISYYQIRRENSRKIITELNLFQSAYCLFNALILPHQSDTGEIEIPDSDLHYIEASLVRLSELALRIPYLDRISLPVSSFSKKILGINSKTNIIENSFFNELTEFIRQCYNANNAFRLTYGVKDEATRKMCQASLKESINSIIKFSDLEGQFDKRFKTYMQINEKILKISKVKSSKHVTASNYTPDSIL